MSNRKFQQLAVCLSLLIYFFSSNIAFGLILPTLIADSPQTLPQGRFMLSYVVQKSSLNQRYNAASVTEPYSQNFNRSLSWNEVADADSVRSPQLRGLLQTRGVNLADSAGDYQGDFAGQFTATVPVLGYGITDRLGIFVAVPIVHFQVNTSIAYRSSPSTQAFLNELNQSQQTGVAREFESALQRGVQDRLAEAGYNYQESVDQTLIGDVQVDLPYVLSGPQDRNAWALVSSLVLPTGQIEDPTDLYGVTSGQGRFGIGSRFVYSWNTSARFSLTGSIGGMVRTPLQDRLTRVPRSDGDQLSPDLDPTVRFGWGWTGRAQVSAKTQVSRSWHAQLGFQRVHQFADSVSGSRFGAERYAIISRMTEEKLDSGFLSVAFNSIRSFLDQDFPVPLQFTAGFAVPFSGRMTLADTLVMGQVTLFL